uniref:Uncharacterized protein n=1 Tax=uncultured Desulfobacterium sp. TaxID=201089 RepID=E1YMB4_9BACT|nr:hypothetical protein N47_E47590 [uncultured Desulfobacterium sp.]
MSLPNTSNKLYLLTAGERDENYFKKVRNLDIQSFYEQSNGGELIEYLRNEFKRKFDFIFIDSRTGITDIGGVCTIQLPDILVLFFIASDQSFNGIIKVAKKAYDVQKNWTIDRQGLASIPVASRFDFNSEYETAKYWINRFASQLNDIYGRWLPVQSNTSLEDLVQKQIDMLMNTKLPYIPYFSFDEKMPVFEEKHNPGGLKYAYENIAALIANNLEDADQLINDRDTYIRKAAERPQATSKGGDLIMDNPSPSMPADEYIESEGFRLFLDETIRQNACNAVELFLKDNKPIKNAQLNAIPPAIQARGFSGLKDLIENQKGKDTKPENKAFWEFLNNIILAQPGSEFSLRQIIQNELKAHNLLTEETMSHDKIEQKKIRKANKAIVDEVLNHSIAIYFEHFNSHYFYITKQGAVS